MQTARQPNIVGKDQRESGLCDYHAKHGKDTKLPSATVPIARAQRPDTLYEQRSPAEVTKKLLARSGTRADGLALAVASSPVIPVQDPPHAPPAPAEVKQEQAPTPTLLSNQPMQDSDSEEEVDGPWKEILDRGKRALANSTYEGSVDPRRIRQMPGQPRKVFNEVRLRRLRKSMQESGQIQPITLRAVFDSQDYDYELVDGERRWRAALEVGEVVLPLRAMVVEIDDEAAQYVISVLANFNREEHTPLEASDAIVQMHEKLKVPMPAICRMFGKSLLWVAQRYGLRRLVPEVREMLDPELAEEHQLSITAAIQISAKKPETQLSTAQRVMRGELQAYQIRSEALARGEATNEYRRKPSHTVEILTNNVLALKRGASKVRSMVLTTDESVLLGMTALKRTELLGILGSAKEIIEGIEESLDKTSKSKDAKGSGVPVRPLVPISGPVVISASSPSRDLIEAKKSDGLLETSYYERVPGGNNKILVKKKIDVVFYGKLREAGALQWQIDNLSVPQHEVEFCERMQIRFS